MNTETKRLREGGHFAFAARSHRLATAILALTILCPMFALAQVPARTYWKSLAGANGVAVIYQSISGNANPMDPASTVSPGASVDATMAIVGYAKMLPLFDRTLTLTPSLAQVVGQLRMELFSLGAEPECLDAADADGNLQIELTDAIYILNYLFLSGNQPPEPGPDACGIGPTPRLGCLKYNYCK